MGRLYYSSQTWVVRQRISKKQVEGARQSIAMTGTHKTWVDMRGEVSAQVSTTDESADDREPGRLPRHVGAGSEW